MTTDYLSNTKWDSRWNLDITQPRPPIIEQKVREEKKEHKWFWKICWGAIIFAVGYIFGIGTVYLYVAFSGGGA